MPLEIIPIGVFGAFPLFGYQTNYLVRSKGQQLLIDCGTTACAAMCRIKIPFDAMDDVLLTHFHLDHVGGLVQLAWERFARSKPPVLLHVDEALEGPLWDNFLYAFLGRIGLTNGEIISPSREKFFRVNTIKPFSATWSEPFEAAGFSIRLVKTWHVALTPSFGVIINDKVFITSDTVFIPDVLEQVVNNFPIEAIFHDVSFQPEMEKIHATYEQLLSLPEDLRQLLILTHYEETAEDGDWELELGEAGKIYTF